MERLKASRDARRAANKYSAAEGHKQNDKYLSDFEQAWREVGGAEDSASSEPTIQALQLTRDRAPRADEATGSKPAVDEAHDRGLEYQSDLPERVADGWLAGPVDEFGTRVDLSDRPTVCSAADWDANEVVVGCTDHALYVLDVDKGRKKRTLHNARNGHAEWVTCVTYLSNGSILSGGMDSKLCLWSGTRATDLKGHSGPVSQVCCDASSSVAVSASYDKTLRVWTLSGQERACLRGHVAPVLELRADNCGHAISGDRSGHVRLWDLASGSCTWALKGVHEGHVTALAWADASGGNEAWRGCFASGGQDGRLRLWDPRAHSNPVKLALHRSDSGKGAVTGIVLGGPAASYMAATCGADGTVRVVDARAGVGELACIELTDFPYSFTAAGGLVLAGCGDGSVHVIDLATLQALYALGANKHAVRTLDASSGKLVCSGDDGKALVYDFL